MQKNYSLPAIALSIAFCVGSLAINIIYLRYFRALYIAGIAVSGISILITAFCLFLRLKNKNRENLYYNTLMRISVITAVVALGIPVIGTLIIMFI